MDKIPSKTEFLYSFTQIFSYGSCRWIQGRKIENVLSLEVTPNYGETNRRVKEITVRDQLETYRLE